MLQFVAGPPGQFGSASHLALPFQMMSLAITVQVEVAQGNINEAQEALDQARHLRHQASEIVDFIAANIGAQSQRATFVSLPQVQALSEGLN